MKISKTAIFLFELMVVILVFSLAAAVCTNIFGKAYEFSVESKALTMAVLKAESMAERFKAGDLSDELSYSAVQEFDEDWNDAGGVGDKPVYRLQADVPESVGGMRTCEIRVIEKDDPKNPIYELEVKSYGQ